MQTHYTVTAKGNLLLELPVEASILNIQPGTKFDITLETKAVPNSVKRISARGKLRGISSSEDFMRRKQEESDWEDRSRR